MRTRSTKGRDVGVKLPDYFSLPSVRHYLIVRAGARVIVHHAHQDDGTILTRITHGEPILLDPPCILLSETALCPRSKPC